MTDQERLGRLEEKVTGIDIKVDSLAAKFDKFIDGLDDRLERKFAPKYVEKAVWYVAGIFTTGVMWVVINYISAHVTR